MSTAVRTALIGAGTWGEVMLGAWDANPTATTLAVCDLDGDRAAKAAAKFGIEKVYTDLETMLETEDIDAVGIATPDFAHRDPVIACLQRDTHVLVQKPLATTVADAQAIVAAEKASNAHLMVDYQHRWGVGFREAKRIVGSPTYGAPVHGRIRMSNQRRIPLETLRWSGQSNVLWFIGTHTLDLLRHVMASEPIRVVAAAEYGVLRDNGADTPDFFQPMIQFDNGAWIQMENSWVLPNGDVDSIEMSMDLYGSNETLRVKSSPSELIVHATQQTSQVPAGSRGTIMGRNLSIDHFIEAVRTGQEPSVTAHDGLMNTAALVAIERSVAEGRIVELAEVLDTDV